MTTHEPADPTLRGIGLLRSEWEATHEPAPGYVIGSTFGPMIGGLPKYAAVSSRADDEGNDRVIMYSINLPVGASPEDAGRITREEIPSGQNVIVPVGTGAGCIMWRLGSARLSEMFPNDDFYISMKYDGDISTAITFFAKRRDGNTTTCGEPGTWSLFDDVYVRENTIRADS